MRKTRPGTVETAAQELDGRVDSKETVNAINSALDMWRDQNIMPSPATIESPGGGWVGEEALAIGLYCALVAGDDLVKFFSAFEGTENWLKKYPPI